jgi:hypothetical protein
MKSAAIAVLAACLLAAGPAPAADAMYGDPDTPVAAQALGMTIRTRDAEELRYAILKRLTDRYAAEQGITVTAAERADYSRSMEDLRRRDREKRAARRAELTRQLASRDLQEAERSALQSELDTLNKLDDMLAEPAGTPEEVAAARDEIAAAFIRQWKINRALYRQYGGRIIFQQGGPEPLDAYRRFLEAARARGDFEIVDPDLEAAFWRYYRTDAIHSFYPPGSSEESQAFATPWWLAK